MSLESMPGAEITSYKPTSQTNPAVEADSFRLADSESIAFDSTEMRDCSWALRVAILLRKSKSVGGSMPLQRSVSVFFAFSTVALGVLIVRAPNPHASQSTAATAQTPSPATPLILQEDDGEHRLRRPGGPAGSGSVPGFIIKIDKQNGNAEDFYVGYEI